ncbi:MAG TPA: NAD(+) synthase [Trueperaceae bacterium]|nr:NAD(+) synthase [Trueperaceae bacterium]
MSVRTVPHDRLRIDAEPLTRHLVAFLADTARRLATETLILPVSGGVDSATVAQLATRAMGPERVVALQLPYRDLGIRSLEHGRLVIDRLGLRSETVDIGTLVDGYADAQEGMDWRRRGNVQARARMMVLFDKMKAYDALPLGTGNRTELLFGYFTEHGDDAAQIQPLLDLYKTQVWQLAEHLGVPDEIIAKAPSAGLEPDQTDEGDFGLSYATADLVLCHLEAGFPDDAILALGVSQRDLDAVRARVRSSYRKRLGTLVPPVQPGHADPGLFFRPHGGTSG